MPDRDRVSCSSAHNTLTFVVNRQRYEVRDPDPEETLLDFLRREGLTGTKLGCGEGGCGACTVVVSSLSGDGGARHDTINACLAPLCSVDGRRVVTVEGIPKRGVPARVAEFHGSQCGYCTPGIVMSLHGLLLRHHENKHGPTLADVEECFDGNLCRCTGYRSVLDAAKSCCADEEKDKCPTGEEGEEIDEVEEIDETNDVVAGLVRETTRDAIRRRVALRYDDDDEEKDSPSLPVAPPVAKTFRAASATRSGAEVTWHRPTTLAELLELKRASGSEGVVVGGNTELGVEARFQRKVFRRLISCDAIVEEGFRSVTVEEETRGGWSLVVGGGATLSAVREFVAERTPGDVPPFARRGWEALEHMLRWFASNQIRNVATLAGNVVTASPISDTLPVLMALGAVVVLRSQENGERRVRAEDLVVGYRRADVRPHEVLTRVEIPSTTENEHVRVYKQARRRDDDVSVVNACFRVELAPRDDAAAAAVVCRGARAFYGGMAAVTRRAAALERCLVGRAWTPDGVREAEWTRALLDDLGELPDSVPGGMARYRNSLAASFFHKCFVDLAVATDSFPVDPRERSAARNFLDAPRPVTFGSRTYEVPARGGLHKSRATATRDHEPADDDDQVRAPVGQPVPHLSGLAQCAGEAVYCDDVRPRPDALEAALVLSSRPRAELTSIDADGARAVPGFVALFTAADLPPERNVGAWPGEELFRSRTVTAAGQTIGLVVAETRDAARRAAALVKVEYEDLSPVIVDIADAIRHGSYFGDGVHRSIEHGDAEAALAGDDVVVVEGETRVGGQEHFYLETMACVVTPGEGDELFVLSSTQNPQLAQSSAARACGVGEHAVVCKTKRLGGGFGGKESRTAFLSTAVAVAAHRLRRPVRASLDRDVDMWTSGGRNPFYGTYKVAATKNGTIVAADIVLYNNAGYSLELSGAVMERALFHCHNAYKIPNLRVKGYVCRTNTVTNTAFRGFGAPQAMLVCETFVDHVAERLGLPPDRVRRSNLLRENDVTHFGMVVERNPLTRLFDDVLRTSDYRRRSSRIRAFNEEHRWRKRGICVLPTKFGVSFTFATLNQAGALAHVYTDGTVLVSHGGTEMGQGLHTKVVQIAARTLDVPLDAVRVADTSTDKVPNASPTAASAGSDLYGMAVLHACEILRDRVAPYRHERRTFAEAVAAAYLDRVHLSAQGFYKTPVSGYDWDLDDAKDNSERGTPFSYFTFGVACSEVEIDVLTGDSRVLRADVAMDVGNSLNPAIDVGQIEGAFVQGMGLTTTEEVVWGRNDGTWPPPGECRTRGPGTYKIPSFNDAPVDFRVALSRDNANPRAVHSSRAIGEPPLFLGSTVYFATKEAVRAARRDAGRPTDEHLSLDSPLTSERVRMSCGDRLLAGKEDESDRTPKGFW